VLSSKVQVEKKKYMLMKKKTSFADCQIQSCRKAPFCFEQGAKASPSERKEAGRIFKKVLKG
jgi:hypothetical protein